MEIIMVVVVPLPMMKIKMKKLDFEEDEYDNYFNK